MAPVFLQLDEVFAIHVDQITRYGGEPGIRDLGLLESAISMPRAGFGGEYLHEDLYHMAAAYLFHIVQNHPFVDGNKRVGLVTALVFLEFNGIIVEADESGIESLVLATAKGERDKPTIATFLKANTK